MVPTKDEKIVGVFDFVGEKKANGFEAVFPTVDVVTQKQVIGLWGEVSSFKKTKKVGILAMDIPCESWVSFGLFSMGGRN